MVSLILDGFINAGSSDTLDSTCTSAQILPKINEVGHGGSISSLAWALRERVQVKSFRVETRNGVKCHEESAFRHPLLPFLTLSLAPRLVIWHATTSRNICICGRQSDPSGRVSVCSTSWQKAQKSSSHCSSRCCSQQQASTQTWWKEIGIEGANVHVGGQQTKHLVYTLRIVSRMSKIKFYYILKQQFVLTLECLYCS